MSTHETTERREPDGFVPRQRAALYTVPVLLGGWSADDETSYAKTLDARVYLVAHEQGRAFRHRDAVATKRALHDVSITRALASSLVGARPVAIMGGHDLARNDPAYWLVAGCAAALTQASFTVLTGGGPGAMEAAHSAPRRYDVRRRGADLSAQA
jgi:hypothetical protein